MNIYPNHSAIDTDLLQCLGIPATATVALNLTEPELTQLALDGGEGVLTEAGVLMCDTGKFTGRSPKDKFIVRDALTEDTVWWGPVNQPIEPEQFDHLHRRMLASLEGRSVFVRYVKAGADPRYAINIAVINEYAWHNLFCHNLFIETSEAERADFKPDWTILNLPGFQADPATDGTRQGNFTIINFSKRVILIGGTGYAGEMKKGIFSVLNLTLPRKGVLSMHCSANVGKAGDTALFFGLSGTGKTTLSTDPERELIGDDEHGWSDQVFNFEGGCYAKVVNLSAEHEPEIYGAIRPGAVLENTRFIPDSRIVDYADQSVTENTRTAYPLHYIANRANPSVGPVPRNIFFLTADAFGVLPPIAKLTVEQAMYYFLSGYTAKLAGTEVGVKEPVPTFSACFGAAFLPLHPFEYAGLLGQHLKASDVPVWLVNTGWTGGSFGTGHRMKLAHTRAVIRGALSGVLDRVEYQTLQPFGLQVPMACPGIPEELLNPRQTWRNRADYDDTATRLMRAFQENYETYHNAAGQGVEEPSFA
ncbi:phosphoenolpyruvate carboxykinase [ATP] 1 [Dyadobacter endophyticus]|uniref:Phosphoenolpyruvate carboxykinase (ATP) n=1 Tax=Dyadobacter endophyticus TaxID=1749036 RepID=A0ABQ1ZB75_9BACT|nr:phosphoenolpyruvate carboxykinase (ATP) [Dyadobacter endophyticus]GGH53201.1 phosphoenolpyruvate carboxykinase [ATP] 1 [Dyadobacter endophyticus]